MTGTLVRYWFAGVDGRLLDEEPDAMDTWDEGSGYDDYMGRWSRPMARQFLSWLDVPPGVDWVDVGCGTGALAGTIAETAQPGGLAGVDPSAGFIAAARDRLSAGADLRVGDAGSLPFDTDSFDAAVSGLALNFVPEPGAAVVEMKRVIRTGGVVAAYVWDYADGMEMIRAFWDAAVTLDSSIEHLDEAVRFPLCRPEPLTELLQRSGLSRVEAAALEIPTVFGSFDEYWLPMLGAQGPAPSYIGSLQERDRERLRERLRTELPTSAAGNITLTARAWAVRGIT